MMVPVHQGIARITIDTSAYAGTVDLTSDAKLFYQKAVFMRANAKFPNLSTTRKSTATVMISLVMQGSGRGRDRSLSGLIASGLYC
jgi:hypothetical protein